MLIDKCEFNGRDHNPGVMLGHKEMSIYMDFVKSLLPKDQAAEKQGIEHRHSVPTCG